MLHAFSRFRYESVRPQLARGVEKRGAPGLVPPSSVQFYSFLLLCFLGWRSWWRSVSVALVAAASAMRRIGVAFVCASCCWGTSAVWHRLWCVLALCGGSLFPRLLCDLPVPFVLLRIPIHGRRD
jgi:hypothetical protein